MFTRVHTHSQIGEGSQVWWNIIPTVRRRRQENTEFKAALNSRDQGLHENLSTIIYNNSKKAKREGQELLH